MWQVIGNVLNIALQIFAWYKSKKESRDDSTKEILNLFKKISKEGDVLFDDLSKEMNRRSNVDWNDIEVRDNGGQR